MSAEGTGRRYATALDLAEDLRRFQAGEPVRRARVGALERCWKWSRRRPTLVAIYGLLLTALVFGTGGGGALWLWQNAEASREEAIWARNQAVALAGEKQKLADANAALAGQERQASQDLKVTLRRAEDESSEAEEVTALFVGTFQASDPLGIDVAMDYIPKPTGLQLSAVREVLVRGERKCRDELSDQPAVQAKLMDTIGAVYLAQGKFLDARRLLEDASAIRGRTLEPNALDVAANKHNLGRLRALSRRIRQG